eukprot:767924-Hanusia_phi.AAC.2
MLAMACASKSEGFIPCCPVKASGQAGASYHSDLGEPADKGQVSNPQLRVGVEEDADLGGLELVR